jgi:hypothetical protein
MEVIVMECVSKTDFTKGFQSFHIKWPLHSVEAKDLQTKIFESQEFETLIADGDRKIEFEWTFFIGEGANDPNKRRFGLKLMTLDVVLPVIYRLSLASVKNGSFFDRHSFRVFGNEYNGWGFELTPEKVATFHGNDLIMHCWFNIPPAVFDF